MMPVIQPAMSGMHCRPVRGVYLLSVWLHALAAMTWIGGMVVFVVGVMPYFRQQPSRVKAEFLEWFGPRFRAVSSTCFTTLAISGSFNLWARGSDLRTFFDPNGMRHRSGD
jgi:uncharacterized membrane protein